MLAVCTQILFVKRTELKLIELNQILCMVCFVEQFIWKELTNAVNYVTAKIEHKI